MRPGRKSFSLVTDDLRGLRGLSGDEEQYIGVNYMLEVNLVRCDDVLSVSREREKR